MTSPLPAMRAPIFISELELTEPIPDICLPVRDDGRVYHGARLLVRMQDIPIGYVFLDPEALTAKSIVDEIWIQLSPVINAQRSARGLSVIDGLSIQGIKADKKLVDQLTWRPLVTVVLCTRDRPEGAIATLRNLVSMHYEPFEIVVVDNAPSSDMTKTAVLAEFGADTRVRYVREHRPGLSCARNRGVTEASGDIVAFTDDDVRVDPWWLNGIVRGFKQATNVACVTGLIPTAVIDNEVQLYFDRRETWGWFFNRRIFDLTDNRDSSPLYPYYPGIYGAGANFAMRKNVLQLLGGFDEALGAGSPCGGGEDIDMFMRVVLGGYQLAYEPSAIISHFHRAELGDLAKQMTAYGSGLTAALTAIVMRIPRAKFELAYRVASGVTHVFKMSDRVQGDSTLPSGLMKQEIYGMLRGPWLYFKGRRLLRRLTSSSDE